MKSIGKKMLAWMLGVLLIAGCCLVAGMPKDMVSAADTYTSGDFEYTVWSEYHTEITGYNGSALELEIPSELDGHMVTSIGFNAFRDCTNLTSVTIPDSVTTIGSCSFYGCIGLTSVSLPDTLFQIESNAFEGCTNLSQIVIPDGVEYIGEEAFLNCINLVNILIPDTVVRIGEDAFTNTSYYNNENNWKDNVLYINNHLIKAKSLVHGEYSVRLGTKTISGGAFYDCAELTGITVPEGILEIGEYTFAGCTGLTNIVLPNSITNIAYRAFDGCTSLTSITIPDSVTEIDSAFPYCESLTELTIPGNITQIVDVEMGVGLVTGCTNLTTLVFEEGVEYIGGGNEYYGGVYPKFCVSAIFR